MFLQLITKPNCSIQIVRAGLIGQRNDRHTRESSCQTAFYFCRDVWCSLQLAQNITTEIKSGLTEALSGVPITLFLYCSAAAVLGCACPVVISFSFFLIRFSLITLEAICVYKTLVVGQNSARTIKKSNWQNVELFRSPQKNSLLSWMSQAKWCGSLKRVQIPITANCPWISHEKICWGTGWALALGL